MIFCNQFRQQVTSFDYKRLHQNKTLVVIEKQLLTERQKRRKHHQTGEIRVVVTLLTRYEMDAHCLLLFRLNWKIWGSMRWSSSKRSCLWNLSRWNCSCCCRRCSCSLLSPFISTGDVLYSQRKVRGFFFASVKDANVEENLLRVFFLITLHFCFQFQTFFLLFYRRLPRRPVPFPAF